MVRRIAFPTRKMQCDCNLKPKRALKSFDFRARQSVDKVNRLPDAEKRRKARKRRLQKRAHTQTYVTDFAARVDDGSRNFYFD